MRRALAVLLISGTFAAVEPAAAAPVVISSGSLDVQVDDAFPRVVQYTLNGAVMHGQEEAISDITVNGATYSASVTSTVAADHVDYAISAGGETIDARISVDGTAVAFEVTSVSSGVTSLAIPEHNLLSVRSSQPGAALATTTMHTATTGTGDAFTSIASGTATDSSPEGVMYAIANTGSLAGAISTNSYYDHPSGDTAKENGRIKKQVVDQGAYRRAGLWSGDWLVRAEGATENEPLPFAKVVITDDRNDDSEVDWQDGAIAFRDIMTNPQGWENTADRVVSRIPFNFASQATHPFLRTLDETKRVNRATDGLGQFVLLKGYGSEGHDSAHPDYGNINSRAGGADGLNTLIAAGSGYNADFGVHMQATEAYPVAESFSDDLVDAGSEGWDWLDQSYYIRRRHDANSGNRLERLQGLKAKAPDLDFLYVDVWYGDGWETRKFAREIDGLGWQITTEFPDRFEENSLWNHWAVDVNYGGSDLKGINSDVVRFIRNHQRDNWIADHPLLGGAELVAYEGWQGKKDYPAFLRSVFDVNLPTKYLQGFTIKHWSSDRIDFDGGVSVTTSGGERVITKDGHPILDGDAYLLPWSQTQEDKAYHWNASGGTTAWGIPDSWGSPGSVELYELTDDGRQFVDDLQVSGGEVTITADAETPYVVYPSTPPSQADPNWGEGTPVSNPGFFGELSGWSTTGSVSVERNSYGQRELVMGAGDSSVGQTLTGLSEGTYSASVYVQTSSGREATLTVDGESVYTTTSPFRNNTGGDEKNRTNMQRMRVLFDVAAGSTTADLTLSAGPGSAAVTFDDVRVVPTERSPQDDHYFAEDFENVDQGWFPFVVGSAGGSATDPRSHIAQLHDPYTQRGWNGKLVDDVISGGNSLKAHEEREGLIYRTLPQTLRFTPGVEYRVTFDYQQSVGGDYAFVIGSGASEVVNDTLDEARTTTTYSRTFTAGADAWIGMRKLNPQTQNQDRDLIIDNLVVDDLGSDPGDPGGDRLPQSQLSVAYVDSEEKDAVDRDADYVLDGDASTIWHTEWYNSDPAHPHEVQLDLGGTYSVTDLFYLPRQDQANGRIADYEVYVSDDGSTWGSPVASGALPDGTVEQAISLTPKTGQYVRLVALSEVNGNPWTSAAELNVGVGERVPQSAMTVTYADSEETTGEDGAASNVLDGDVGTIWHTEWYNSEPSHPHEIEIDLGASYDVSCVYALPRGDSSNGRIGDYEVYVSSDGNSWGSPVASGTWQDTSAEQSACFTAETARHIRLRALSEVNGNPWTSLAELNIGGTQS